jgi:hypothetical protein
MDHAGTALAGVTADMCAGQALIIAQELCQERAALHVAGRGFAVHGHFDLCHEILPFVTLFERE